MVVPAADGLSRAGAAEASRPALIVFDVNETLSDMSAMAGRFVDVGAPGHLATVWFAGLLRDGFALTAAQAPARLADIGAGLLHVQLGGLTLNRDLTHAVDHIMSGFAGLDLHPDVAPGIASLTGLGLRLVTLSNGSTRVAEDLFDRADIGDHFELLLSVEDAGAWKPAAASYRYALERCDTPAGEAMLVAVHPWDIDGASRAGLRTAWLNRAGEVYPAHFLRPDLEVSALTDLAHALTDERTVG